jgi:anti-sigma28 factor (negative regulator of flagellin synthesis)
MQINPISTPVSIPAYRNNSPATQQPATDQAVLNHSADFFSSLVQEAGQMPEVRSEVVDAFKSRIQSGHYPPPEIIDGLTRLIGGNLAQSAASTPSSSQD